MPFPRSRADPSLAGVSEPGPTFASYDEFFPYYVAVHRRRWRRLGALPGLGYGFAWPAHVLLERNNPASFGHPVWSFRGDRQMIAMMLRGRDGRLQALADGWWAEHPRGAPTGHPLTATAP